jgi:hypothetical protein
MTDRQSRILSCCRVAIAAHDQTFLFMYMNKYCLDFPGASPLMRRRVCPLWGCQSLSSVFMFRFTHRYSCQVFYILEMFLLCVNTIHCIQGHYFTWQVTSVFTQTVSRGQQAAELSPVFQFRLNRVSRLLNHYIAVNIRFLLTCLEKVLEMFTFGLQKYVTSHLVHCTSKFLTLSELTGND